jgi:hypothetical protein
VQRRLWSRVEAVPRHAPKTRPGSMFLSLAEDQHNKGQGRRDEKFVPCFALRTFCTMGQLSFGPSAAVPRCTIPPRQCKSPTPGLDTRCPARMRTGRGGSPVRAVCPELSGTKRFCFSETLTLGVDEVPADSCRNGCCQGYSAGSRSVFLRVLRHLFRLQRKDQEAIGLHHDVVLQIGPQPEGNQQEEEIE